MFFNKKLLLFFIFLSVYIFPSQMLLVGNNSATFLPVTKEVENEINFGKILLPKGFKFLVLAEEDFWKVVSSEEFLSIIKTFNGTDIATVTKMADALKSFAIKKGCRPDFKIFVADLDSLLVFGIDGFSPLKKALVFSAVALAGVVLLLGVFGNISLISSASWSVVLNSLFLR